LRETKPCRRGESASAEGEEAVSVEAAEGRAIGKLEAGEK
jgi:hypothetical protein